MAKLINHQLAQTKNKSTLVTGRRLEPDEVILTTTALSDYSELGGKSQVCKNENDGTRKVTVIETKPKPGQEKERKILGDKIVI